MVMSVMEVELHEVDAVEANTDEYKGGSFRCVFVNAF